MASFKRNFLKSIGLNDDQIGAVMDAHLDVVNELTADRDKYKKEADKVPDLQKQLKDAETAGKDKDGKDYKTLFEELQASTAAEKARTGKVAGFEGILKDLKIPKKFWPMLVKANADTINKMELDGEKVKDADTLKKDLQVSLKDYVSEEDSNDPEPSNPPGGNQGGKKLDEMSMEEYIAARTEKK